MNILIGLVLITCLGVSELNSQSPAVDVWIRISSLLLLTFCVPGLAVFQTLLLSRRFRGSEIPIEKRLRSLNRLSVLHSAVWLASSIVIVWGIQWQTVVRVNWGLSEWPLIDEALILLPIVLSLVASWAVFYDVQAGLNKTGQIQTGQNQLPKSTFGDYWQHVISKERLFYVANRFRVYFVMTLIPLAVLVLLRDVAAIYSPTSIVTLATIAILSALLTIGFPFILALLWNVKPISDNWLAAEVNEFCEKQNLRVASVRVWNTDNQISNAVVAGFIPWFRMIIITDGMLKRFPKNELIAILRHEAGHIRLWHLPIRIGFVILPLMLLAVAETFGTNPQAKLNQLVGLANAPEWLPMTIVYCIYLTGTLTWLSRKMEYEADLFAATCVTAPSENLELAKRQQANAMLDALLRFASLFPDQLDRSTLFHPSLRQRMKRIVEIRDSHVGQEKLQQQWKLQKLFFLLCVVAVCLTAYL